MDLTNIVLGLEKGKFASFYDGVYYQISVITNSATLQTELDLATGVTVTSAVVQYKDNSSVPRIVCSDGTDGVQPDPLPLDSISTELSDALVLAKEEVEEEITSQTA